MVVGKNAVWGGFCVVCETRKKTVAMRESREIINGRKSVGVRFKTSREMVDVACIGGGV